MATARQIAPTLFLKKIINFLKIISTEGILDKLKFYSFPVIRFDFLTI